MTTIRHNLSVRDPSIWAMGSDISDSLAMVCAMVVANKYGTIFRYTRDIGSKTGPMVEAGSSIQMAMFMRVSGRTIRLTGKESIRKTMARAIQGSGSKISSTGLASNAGPMAHHTRGMHKDMQLTSRGVEARQGKVHLA